MNQQLPVHRLRTGLRAALAAIGLALAGTATAQTADADAGILVLASHFVYRGTPIDDLDVLERGVMPRTPRSVALDACGTAAARSLLAAAHRFRNLEIRIRLLDGGGSDCAGETDRRVAALGSVRDPPPRSIDEAAVQRWWAQQMP